MCQSIFHFVPVERKQTLLLRISVVNRYVGGTRNSRKLNMSIKRTARNHGSFSSLGCHKPQVFDSKRDTISHFVHILNAISVLSMMIKKNQNFVLPNYSFIHEVHLKLKSECWTNRKHSFSHCCKKYKKSLDIAFLMRKLFLVDTPHVTVILYRDNDWWKLTLFVNTQGVRISIQIAFLRRKMADCIRSPCGNRICHRTRLSEEGRECVKTGRLRENRDENQN